ncbi:MAG: hypothetical protein ACR2J0_01730, partial [Mycobacteriales bacterium]
PAPGLMVGLGLGLPVAALLGLGLPVAALLGLGLGLLLGLPVAVALPPLLAAGPFRPLDAVARVIVGGWGWPLWRLGAHDRRRLLGRGCRRLPLGVRCGVRADRRRAASAGARATVCSGASRS